MKNLNRTSFVLGVVFALGIIGCMAVVTMNGEEYPTIIVGEEYEFRASDEVAWGTATSVGPGAWVTVEREGGDGQLYVWQVNLRNVFRIQQVLE